MNFKREAKGFALPLILGVLMIMLILAFSLHTRFSQQASQSRTADQSAVARFFLESCTSDVLWQIRRSRNDRSTSVFSAFRNGVNQSDCPINYQPSSLIEELARELQIKIGTVSASFKGLKPLTFNQAAFSSTGENHEKQGNLIISCNISLQKRDYSLETAYPFKVVMTTTPVLRSFVLFFDQLHLEQSEPFGSRDKINIIPIRNNFAPPYQSPVSLYGWAFDQREMNGNVFLGKDNEHIRLNLVGGAFQRSSPTSRMNLEDLWQISPSAFSITSGMSEFDQEELLNDANGNPLIVRGASIPMVYRGHFARIGLLGFSDELLDSGFFGNFKLENFLAEDPSFAPMRFPEYNLKQASALRLFGNQIFSDFTGFQRNVYGQVWSRFFLLSFFDAPSVGVPIAYNANPSHSITVPQYGGAQRIPFKPVSGDYTSHMSRIVSGNGETSILGDEARVPANRDAETQHQILTATDFPALDGLKPARNFSDIAAAWFPIPAGTGTKRPEIKPGSVLERVSKWYRNGADFKKDCGLQDSRHQKFWVDGIVYVNGPLDLSEGITTDDIRGGIVLVNGPIRLGNVTRELDQTMSDQAMKTIKEMPLHQVLTFVSLSGEKITLTGNKYFGVQLFSFKPGLAGPIQQLSFAKGEEMVFIGGIGMSTPQLAEITRQLPNRGVYPYFNYLPALAGADNHYSVNIGENIEFYEFQVN